MQEYVIELSKYFIAIFMALYTYECFAVFRFREEGKRHGIYVRQRILLFLIQLLCFVDLTLVSGQLEYLFFYIFIQVFLFAALMLTSMIYEKINGLLLNNMCMLLGIGLCMIARLSFNKAVKQYVIAVLSMAAALLAPYVLNRFHFWKKLTWTYALAGIIMLSVVLILGEVTHGSKIRFSIGGVSFQPSEFVKIIFIFFLAAALWEDASLKKIIFTAAVAGAHVIVLVVSKDLGSALIFFVGFLFVVFIATRNYWYLFIGTAGGCLASWGAYMLFDHVKVRVLAWQDPWSYIDNQGYQITQSLFAIGSGSWFGMGLLKGNPKAIPYVDADFIFSSVCEELGVIFGICVILVCISCFVMIMDITVKLRDRFYQLIAYGLGIIYIFQIFLTVGGGIKFIPLTGVTLPFISYGGSSVLTTMIMFFIVQALYIRMQQEGEKRLARKKKTAPGPATRPERSGQSAEYPEGHTEGRTKEYAEEYAEEYTERYTEEYSEEYRERHTEEYPEAYAEYRQEGNWQQP